MKVLGSFAMAVSIIGSAVPCALALDGNQFAPAPDRVDSFSVRSGRVPDRSHRSFSVGFDHANEPVPGVVDAVSRAHLAASWVAFGGVALGLVVPFFTAEGPGGDDAGLDQTTLSAKVRLFESERRGPRLALAAIPHVDMPGSSGHAATTDAFGAGGSLAGEAAWRRARVLAELGYAFRGDGLPDVGDDDEIRFGVAADAALFRNRPVLFGAIDELDFAVELAGALTPGEAFDEEATAAELLAGFRFRNPSGFFGRLGIGGTVAGDGPNGPGFRVVFIAGTGTPVPPPRPPAIDPGPPPPAPPPPPVARVVPTDEELVPIEMIHHDVASVSGGADSRAVLADVLRLLRRDPDLTLRIEGHTDSAGDAEANRALGLRRAESARDWLVEREIDPSRIEVRSWGEERPIETNETEDGRRRNRRTEFHVEMAG